MRRKASGISSCWPSAAAAPAEANFEAAAKPGGVGSRLDKWPSRKPDRLNESYIQRAEGSSRAHAIA